MYALHHQQPFGYTTQLKENNFQFFISDATVTLKFDQHHQEQYKREQYECVQLYCFCPIQKLKSYLSHFKQKSQTAVSKLEGNIIPVTSFHYNDWFTQTLIFLMPLSRSRSSKFVVVGGSSRDRKIQFEIPLKTIIPKDKMLLINYQVRSINYLLKTQQESKSKTNITHTFIYMCAQFCPFI